MRLAKFVIVLVITLRQVAQQVAYVTGKFIFGVMFL